MGVHELVAMGWGLASEEDEKLVNKSILMKRPT
jgi:hypothetical protein